MRQHPAYDRAQYAEAVLSLGGCVGFWRLDEAIGTTAKALAGGNGTYTGSPVLNKPSLIRDGASIGLNGSSMYVTIADASGYSAITTGQLTWSFWTKPTNNVSTHVMAKGAGSGSWEWSMRRGVSTNDGTFTNGEAFTAQLWQSNGANHIVTWSAAGTAPNGQWTHFVCTYRSGVELILYLNGKQEGRSTIFNGTTVDGNSAVNIGRRPDNTLYYNGDVGDVSMHNRALTANEVLWLYEEGLR